MRYKINGETGALINPSSPFNSNFRHKFVLLFLAGILLILSGYAQQVTNIRVSQEGDRVVIYYDLMASQRGHMFDITVRCSPDGGKNFSIMPQSLTGDLKGVTAGTGRKIIWDVLNERETLTGDAYVFQINATARNPEDSSTGNTGRFTDSHDGKVYKWVKIGTQIWMAENLKATKYRDGTAIPSVTNNTTWQNLTTGAYCWYDNDTSNKSTYGALYNWYAVNTGKLCPTGWHVPSDAEWTTLSTFLGGKSVAGGKMKSTTGWESPNTEATNSSGFSALPGGYRGIGGTFGGIGDFGYWWSSAEYSTTSAWDRSLVYYGLDVDRGSFGMDLGFSVRCVRD